MTSESREGTRITIDLLVLRHTSSSPWFLLEKALNPWASRTSFQSLAVRLRQYFAMPDRLCRMKCLKECKNSLGHSSCYAMSRGWPTKP